MIVFLIVVALLALGMASPLALQAYRRRRMTAELRKDWWPRFERDLREYMSQTWRSARETERHV